MQTLTMSVKERRRLELRGQVRRGELKLAKLTIGPAHPRGTQVTCTLPRQQDAWQAGHGETSLALSPKPETADSASRAE